MAGAGVRWGVVFHGTHGRCRLVTPAWEESQKRGLDGPREAVFLF
jgi:hypothetical protein